MSAKRKRNKSTDDSEDAGEHTEIADTRIKVERSKNTGIAVGSHNVINLPAEQKPINVHPYDANEFSFIGIGERLMRLFYGTANHDLKWWTRGSLLASLISGGTFGSPFIPNSPVSLGSQYYIPVSLAGLVGILLTILLGWGPIEMARKTECPKCHYRFSFFNIKKTLTNTQSLSDEEVRNYRIKKRCENCGHTATIEKVEHIPHEPADDNGI